MSKILGVNATLITAEATFDPLQGYTLTQRWEGSGSALLSLGNAFSQAGARATLSTDNGKSVLNAIFGGQIGTPDGQAVGSAAAGAEQAPIDRYTVSSEFADVSVFNNPYVIAESITYISTAQYKKDIETAVNDGTTLTLSTVNFPFAHIIYRLLSRGGDAYQVRRPTLKRTRSMPVYSAQRMTIGEIDPVLSTAALIALMGIPVAIQSMLPVQASLPTPPADTAWAWKLRSDTSDYVLAANKIEETKEWVFAAWHTLLYTYVP